LLEKHFRWFCWSPILGGVTWLAFLAASVDEHSTLGTIEVLFLLAPLVIVPLGLLLTGIPGTGQSGEIAYRTACYLQFPAALAMGLSFGFSPGLPTALLASGWCIVSILVGWSGFIRILQRKFVPLEENCVDSGLLFLPIGGFSIVLSRMGVTPLDYGEPIVILTAVHFHYAGFAAPLLAGLVGRNLAHSYRYNVRALFRFVATGVILGPPLLAAGFVSFSPLLKLISASLLVASLMGLSALSIVVMPKLHSCLARVLLCISALSLPIGMLLAGVYAAGEFTGEVIISIAQMAKIHGLINAVGFTLCGLLAWALTHLKLQKELETHGVGNQKG
jgi:hypothetical protein